MEVTGIKVKDQKWEKLLVITQMILSLQMITQDLKILKKFEKILKKALKKRKLSKFLIEQ